MAAQIIAIAIRDRHRRLNLKSTMTTIDDRWQWRTIGGHKKIFIDKKN